MMIWSRLAPWAYEMLDEGGTFLEGRDEDDGALLDRSAIGQGGAGGDTGDKFAQKR